MKNQVGLLTWLDIPAAAHIDENAYLMCLEALVPSPWPSHGAPRASSVRAHRAASDSRYQARPARQSVGSRVEACPRRAGRRYERLAATSSVSLRRASAPAPVMSRWLHDRIRQRGSSRRVHTLGAHVQPTIRPRACAPAHCLPSRARAACTADSVDAPVASSEKRRGGWGGRCVVRLRPTRACRRRRHHGQRELN